MNNEPVAWMSNGKEFYVQKNYCPDFIPLYTHPVKELTDEEMYEFTHRMVICSGQNPNAADINIFGLVRIVEDILRKAQEKCE
jgi:hypothetical protein